MIPTVQPDDVINAWRNDERTTAVYAFKLQEALASNQLSAFCDEQADEAITADQRLIWAFLSARSLNCSRTAYLNLLKHMLPVINEDENVHSIRKEMDACAAFSVDSDEEDEHLSTGIIMPTPLILKGLTEDEETMINLICFTDPQQAIAEALARKQFALALLIACNFSSDSIIRYIALHIQSGLSHLTRFRHSEQLLLPKF